MIKYEGMGRAELISRLVACEAERDETHMHCPTRDEVQALKNRIKKLEGHLVVTKRYLSAANRREAEREAHPLVTVVNPAGPEPTPEFLASLRALGAHVD